MCVCVRVIVATCVQLEPPPSCLAGCIALFEKLNAKYDAEVAAKECTPIKVTLSDGKVLDGKAWETTPYDVASQISKGLADNAVIARVNGGLWDLDRLLERDVNAEILKFEDTEGMYIVVCSLCVCVCTRWVDMPHCHKVLEFPGKICFSATPNINNGLKFHEWNTFT